MFSCESSICCIPLLGSVPSVAVSLFSDNSGSSV